jgi:hypothetical protein
MLTKPHKSHAAEETGEAVLALLRLTSSTAGIFLPLEGIVGGTLYTTEMVQILQLPTMFGHH